MVCKGPDAGSRLEPRARLRRGATSPWRIARDNDESEGAPSWRNRAHACGEWSGRASGPLHATPTVLHDCGTSTLRERAEHRSFDDPALRHHVCRHAAARRVAMIRLAALAVVVEPR